MKNTKNYIVIVCLVVFGALSYGFITKSGIFANLAKTTKTSSVEKKLTVEQKSKAKFMPPPNTEIVGTWLDEAEEGHKSEFMADGQMKIYVDNALESTTLWEISGTCDGQTFDGQYLKIFDETDGQELCYFITGINVYNSNILSISFTGNGHAEVYSKQ